MDYRFIFDFRLYRKMLKKIDEINENHQKEIRKLNEEYDEIKKEITNLHQLIYRTIICIIYDLVKII